MATGDVALVNDLLDIGADMLDIGVDNTQLKGVVRSSGWSISSAVGLP